MDNFWCLLKRAVKGTYVSVEPFHLFRYLDEQAFRFNERGDGGRFLKVVRTVVGRRLTYKSLIGQRYSLATHLSERGAARRKECDVEKREPSSWERFVDATKRIVSVPKQEVDKRMRAAKNQRERRRRSKRG